VQGQLCGVGPVGVLIYQTALYRFLLSKYCFVFLLQEQEQIAVDEGSATEHSDLQ